MIDRWSTLRSGACAAVSLPCAGAASAAAGGWASATDPFSADSPCPLPPDWLLALSLESLAPQPLRIMPATSAEVSRRVFRRRFARIVSPSPFGRALGTCGTPSPVPADCVLSGYESAAEESRAHHEVHAFLPADRRRRRAGGRSGRVQRAIRAGRRGCRPDHPRAPGSPGCGGRRGHAGAASGVRVFAHADVLPKLAAFGDIATAVEPGQEFEAAGYRVRAYGGQHALIHPDIPRIANLAYLVADDDTNVYHPGDSFTVPEDTVVDTLFVPLNAPWMKLMESIDFVRAVKPGPGLRVARRPAERDRGKDLRRPPGAALRHQLRASGARAPRSPDVPSVTDELIQRLYEAPPDGFVAARSAAIEDASGPATGTPPSAWPRSRSRPWRPGWSTCSRCAAPT